MSTLEKVAVEVLAVLVGAGFWLLVAHLSGGAYPSFGIPVGGARGELRRASSSFLDDLRRRELMRDTLCRSPGDQAALGPADVVRRLLRLEPDAVRITGHKLTSAKVEPGKTRGRVEAQLKYRDLAHKHSRRQELALHFERATPDARWCLKLEESLQAIEAAAGPRR